MNISYEWLRAFVPFDETPAQLRELLTAHVATVDDIVPLRTDLDSIIVARVVDEAPHPDSDHLHVTKVYIGTGELIDVVCGAPNVTAGKLYPFAPVGTVMPNGLKIEKRRIRGALSSGMLCSASELGLGDDGSGLLELTSEAAPGTPILRVLPIGDSRIVLDVGANRPDLLSHLGVAREVAALTNRELVFPTLEGDIHAVIQRGAPVITPWIDDYRLIRRFMGVVIRDVKVGPSPDWLRKAIEAVGGRSINNVVDASNYVLHELGQPTHAFDLSKLAGPKIVVRLAHEGERITTLDGQDRALTDQMIVIADAERPQAIAGIMGGRESEVTDATTDIFLEVANFDPARIRATRKALGLNTDASYRFERGVDADIAPVALERVAQIIVLTAAGRVDGGAADLSPAYEEPETIALRISRTTRVLGDSTLSLRMAFLLRGIGFTVDPETADVLRVGVPSWRGDVTREIDLIEEVARLRGYDSFPNEIRPFHASNAPDDRQWLASRRVRDTLVGVGLLEARPMPFVTGPTGGGDPAGFVRVENPLAENEAFLRREVLDTLARRAEYNLTRMEGDVRLFEIGSIFHATDATLPREELHAAALIMGRRMPRHFTDPKSDAAERWATFGAWDARALGESMARAAYPGGDVVVVEPDVRHPSYDAHPVAMPADSVVWTIFVDRQIMGRVGRVTLDAPIWAAEAWGVELSLGVVDSEQVAPEGHNDWRAPEWEPRAVATYRPLPSTPASVFDLALTVRADLPAVEVEAVIRRTAGDILERLDLFDLYEGKGVEAGHRSLAWRLTFRHPERTLREKEIDARRAKILSALETELNVHQRTS